MLQRMVPETLVLDTFFSKRLRQIKGLFDFNPKYPRPATGDFLGVSQLNGYVTRLPRLRWLCLKIDFLIIIILMLWN